MYDSSISSHLCPVLKPGKIQDLVPIILRNLNEIDNNPQTSFDAIAVCGASGLLLAGLVSYHLNKNIILVRKDSENRHSGLSVEGPMDGYYIIFDDMISTGQTTRFIHDRIKSDLCQYSRCVGVYLWNSTKLHAPDKQTFMENPF